MSLKAFHIVFIIVSIILCFGFGVWLVSSYNDDNSIISLAGAGASFLAGIGLIVYAKYFIQKYKNISYL
ncbi:MAG TPA: hypothetical protein VII11_05100 [Bacteroidota bacterium]